MSAVRRGALQTGGPRSRPAAPLRRRGSRFGRSQTNPTCPTTAWYDSPQGLVSVPQSKDKMMSRTRIVVAGGVGLTVVGIGPAIGFCRWCQPVRQAPPSLPPLALPTSPLETTLPESQFAVSGVLRPDQSPATGWEPAALIEVSEWLSPTHAAERNRMSVDGEGGQIEAWIIGRLPGQSFPVEQVGRQFVFLLRPAPATFSCGPKFTVHGVACSLVAAYSPSPEAIERVKSFFSARP